MACLCVCNVCARAQGRETVAGAGVYADGPELGGLLAPVQPVGTVPSACCFSLLAQALARFGAACVAFHTRLGLQLRHVMH